MFAAVGAVLVAASLADPLALLADDSWFYVVIGRNVAAGHGITFDRVMGTNGFQPLWGAVVAATALVARVVGVDTPLGLARMVLLVGWVPLGVALWRLDRLLGRLGVRPAGIAAAAGLVLAYLGGPLGTLGSEANLHLLLVVLVVERLVAMGERRAPTTGQAAALGALLGLMVLGRLDSGFVAVAAFVVLVVGGAAPRAVAARAALVAGATAAAVTAPYFAWNLVRFGHLMPIAGAIKVDLGRLGVDPEAVGATGFALAALAGAAAVAAFAGRRPTRPQLLAVAPVLAGGLVSTAIYLVAGVGRYTDLDWYRMPLLVAAAVLVGLAVTRLSALRPVVVDVVAWSVVVALLAGTLVVVEFGRLRGANHDHWHPVAEFSEEVGALVPPDEVIATLDFPGVLAAFSGRKVVALDGLTGDYAFQDDLRDLGGACALARRGVRWITVDDLDRLRTPDGRVPGPDDLPPFTVALSSWLHHVDVGTVELRPGDLALDDPTTGLSLWQLTPQCP